jgi:hypothetical protein
MNYCSEILETQVSVLESGLERSMLALVEKQKKLVHGRWQGPADPSSSAAASYANAHHEIDVYQVGSFHVYVSDRQLDMAFGNGAALLAGIVVTLQETTEELLQVIIQSDLSYVPGLLRTTTSTEPSTMTTGLILSTGLSARILARSGTPVLYDNDGHGGVTSDLLFHRGRDVSDGRSIGVRVQLAGRTGADAGR